jgi:hypothetical protein
MIPMKNTRNLIHCFMKIIYLLLIAMASNAYGQGTLIYDQSSATNPLAGGGGAPIQLDQPMGQSFTPTLSSVGFVQLNFNDLSSGLGATVYLNLWSDSISNGTLLASTDPVFMPGGNYFHLVTNFMFSASVSVTPGTTYYLQPLIQSGDASTALTVVDSVAFNYSGGTFYASGTPDPNGQDLWFREGIITVPEPTASLLILLGGGLFLFVRRAQE